MESYCHNIFLCCYFSPSSLQNERGSNTNINPHVHTDLLTEIGISVNYFDDCFLPTLKNLSETEEELFKNNEHFQFYLQINNATDEVVKLVRIVRMLARSDQELTQGSICSIPEVTCTVPDYRTMRDNVSTSY